MRKITSLLASSAALILSPILTACAAPPHGNIGAGGSPETDLLVTETDWPDQPCSMIDQVFYETSSDLESALDVIARGEITSIKFENHSSPTWVVGFHVESAYSPQKVDEITVNFPRICGDAPYGETFAVGNPFILLLSGPHDGADYPDSGYEGQRFSLIQTSQGVIPIIDGKATPLPGAYLDGSPVTISDYTASRFGAPLAATAIGDEFVQTINADSLTVQAGGWAPGIPSGVAPLPHNPEGLDARAGAAWTGVEGLLYVFTWGSSSCPVLAGRDAMIEVTRGPAGTRDVVAVELIEPNPGECTADLAPTTSIVSMPDGVDNNEPITLRLGDDLVELQPRGAEWNPSVGGIIGPAVWVR